MKRIWNALLVTIYAPWFFLFTNRSTHHGWNRIKYFLIALFLWPFFLYVFYRDKAEL